jgi:Na+/H+ antiporter NhaD/arsenite permease-like protein
MMCKFVKKSFLFFRKETVLSISIIFALLSCLFVTPSSTYFSYIDWNTLALLFSLMAIMKGLQKANFFVCMANLFLKKIKTTRTMLFILVFLPFIFSTIITNDVALIAFVPFGLTILQIAGQEHLIVPQVVLQTVAANLGSMLTPMGNPQNLYLYNKSGMEFGEFCRLMFPYVLAAAICLAFVIVLIKPVRISGISLSAELGSTKTLLCYAVGFVLCLFGIFKLLSPVIIAAAVAVALHIYDRKLLVSIDYSLLGTFFAFFIFVGNVAKIEGVQNFLASILEGRIEVVAVLVSQIISNVPASLLLSGFTSQWQGLIIGCNLGGLGTLIASMASLISYKIVVKEYPEQRKRYFRCFTLLNICFLIFLFLLYALI